MIKLKENTLFLASCATILTLFIMSVALIRHRVVFSAGEGEGAAPFSEPLPGIAIIKLPNQENMTHPDGKVFSGWSTDKGVYKPNTYYLVLGNVEFTAQWSNVVTVQGHSLVEKLTWLNNNARSGFNYIVEINADESISPQELFYSGSVNITITLMGIGSNRTIDLLGNDQMFFVGPGVTLVLDRNITLQGRRNNDIALIYVEYGGTLVMNAGSIITGNSTMGDTGGAVLVYRGTFTMTGGAISNNSSDLGGGVLVVEGVFNMSGGTISSNSSSYGGGVFVVDGIFNMSGGTISGNNADWIGGGLGLSERTTFIKTGGTITGYASDPRTGNVVKDDSDVIVSDGGHAVVVWSVDDDVVIKRKDTTAGPGVSMSYNGNGIFSGAWDF